MLFRKRAPSTRDVESGPASIDLPPLGGGRTVIGRQTRVTGRLSGEGPVIVCGDLKGTIAIRGGLRVRDGGRVEADVDAESVELDGEAHGTLRAVERVSMGATGEFDGEIDTPVLDVTPGSIVRGRARVAGRSTQGSRRSH